MSKALPRYPGAQPFETHQSGIFFGRDKDVVALSRIVRQEPLTVLYSKSGMGKSSLLNAGLVPSMEQSGEFHTLRIRFNSFDKKYMAGSQIMPDIKTRKIIRGSEKVVITFLDKLIENEETIWHDLKEQQIFVQQELVKTGLPPKKTLLIFDQFEELFTYPADAILAFRKQLAEALYTPLPSRYWDMLELYGQEESPLNEAEQALLQKPLELRVIMAIRQDRMHLLGQLTDYLPNLNKNWYELRPLTLQQARQAIVAPAGFNGDFISNQYRYEERAIEVILNFLTECGTESVENTQLQIICSSIETKVIQKSLTFIRLTDVGDLDAVIENYYLEKISTVGSEIEQLAARKLLEEGLIYEEEERRLSLYEGLIVKVHAVSVEVLRKLVDSHLLRAEPSLNGGYTYELSHDTLVAPVLKAKSKRKAEELYEAERNAQQLRERELTELRLKAEEERKRAEEERKLREQAEQAKTEAENQRCLAQENELQARQRTRLAAVVSIIALGLALFAGWSYVQARNAYKLAEYNAGLAEGEALKTKTALANLLKEQAEKQMLVFIDKEVRSIAILEAGGCPPQDFFDEMTEIIKNHPDSLLLKERLQTLHNKNPNCK